MTHSPAEISKILNGKNKEKITSVISDIKNRAASGDARANYMIAKWYLGGLFGFKEDKKQYKKYIKIAMTKLLPDAIYDYGVSRDGISKEKSREAVGYYIVASVLGDTDAIDALINCFIYGSGVEKDDFLASALKIHRDHL
jgi:TPR repeat protein